MKKFLFRFSLVLVVVLLVAAAVGGLWLRHMVINAPGEQIRPENIQKILGRESHVYYSDGTTPLGVFFDREHRQYVRFDEIPQNFVNALVAAEDNRFFDHFGIDLESVARAMVKNIIAGRVVQGGSTITQQTAKNLFKRSERSFKEKFREMILALRLEHFYSKKQIFEFYANQFYVSGNGLGLGIAARYYFDKKPEELTLVECAFIAGSVKRPNYYNPFRSKTPEGARQAEQRARKRLGYVLGEMLDLKMIDQATYDEAIATPLEFRQGKVGYALDYVMEVVREAVSTDEVLDALAEHNLDNIATSGVRVVTTIDKNLQAKTLAALRRHLSIADTTIRGYKRSEVQKELAELVYSGDSVVVPGACFFGTVTRVSNRKKSSTRIAVTLDRGLGSGFIDRSGLKSVATGLAKYRRNNRKAKLQRADEDALVAAISEGDRVWVRVIAIPGAGSGDAAAGDPAGQQELTPEQKQNLQFELARWPQILGGAIAIQDGRIIAMAGGVENRFFNRAFTARRTMGSAFKPLVYTAAIQLGWNSADLLRNSRSLFTYQGQPYFPRPDHHSPFAQVSMNWAGVKSENVASIWLLSHLCDKLNREQFREVADRLGFTPQVINGHRESSRAYVTRLRKKIGINVSAQAIKEAAWRRAVKALEADFVFDGLGAEYRVLQNMPWGGNYDRFLEALVEKGKQTKDKRKRAELRVRRGLLRHSYVDTEIVYARLLRFQNRVNTELDRKRGFFDQIPPIYGPLYRGLVDGRFYYEPAATEGMEVFDGEQLIDYLKGMTQTGRRLFWGNVRFGGLGLTSSSFLVARRQFQDEYQRLSGKRPWDYEVLEQLPDFRMAVGLHYLVALGRSMGIESRLQPVLSFPLGSNVVTLFEMTRLYETMIRGDLVTWGGRQTDDRAETTEEGLCQALSIIDHIESEDGRLLYRPRRRAQRIVDPKTSIEINSILENVIHFGTGHEARRSVRYKNPAAKLDLPLPLLGKTGTANDYTNASFFGFVPVAAGNRRDMALAGGYAIGVYVGFDDNRPMRHDKVHLSGSNGALPAWTAIANAVLEEEKLVERLDPKKLSAGGPALVRPQLGQLNLQIQGDAGGRIASPATVVGNGGRAIRTFGTVSSLGRFVPASQFEPFWRHATAGEKQRRYNTLLRTEKTQL